MEGRVARHKEKIGCGRVDPRCTLKFGAFLARMVDWGVFACRKIEDKRGIATVYAKDSIILADVSVEEMARLKRSD
jgi:hypothetical protein